jgi:hypothetical protein
MSIVERVIRALIYLCIIALGFYLCVWVLAELGVVLPYMVITILKVIFVLVAILVLLRLFWPVMSGYKFFPDREG